MTYEYEFVTVERGDRHDHDAHRRVIEERAADGWRLVQIIPPPPARRRKRPGPIELIFERPLPHPVADQDEELEFGAVPV